MLETWLSIAIGAIIVLTIARDVTLTLLAPARRGMLSQFIGRVLWRSFRPVIRRFPSFRELSGPIIVLTILGTWTICTIIGWALIYWPFLPDSFLLDFGVEVERGGANRLVTSVYFSTVVLVTLGFGDIVPTTVPLRILVPFQGMVGIGLLTAGIGWFLSINPALGRRRALAHQISILRAADRSRPEAWNPAILAPHLGRFANDITTVRSDVLQFPVTYYFRDADPAADLISNLPYLIFLANRRPLHQKGENPEFELNQDLLNQAITDYLQTLVRQFHDPDSARSVEALQGLLAEQG